MIPTLAALVLIALFTWLGFWQLDRAEFKEALWAGFGDIEQRSVMPLTSVDALAKLERFAPVTVSGRYLVDRQIMLDNRTRNGRVGVHVYTPLVVSDGVILVNRGWLALSGREALPAADAPHGQVNVTGLVSPFPPTGLVLGETKLPADWPWLTPYLIEPQVEQALDRPVASRVLLLTPQAEHGFIREWEPDTLPPQRHIGYAVQWFALALAVIVAWIVVNVKRLNENQRNE